MNWRPFPTMIAMVLAAGAVWLACVPLHARGAPPAAAPFHATCPATLAAAAFKPDRVPDGWVGVMPQDTRISGAGLLWGPPDESGYLKPDEANTAGSSGQKVNTTRWRLDVPHSFETWVYCQYGPLQLSRRIPRGAVECTASSKVDRTRLEEIVFVCK